MEKELERTLEDVCNNPDVIGCLFANNQGLCLAAKGKASIESAGTITAIMEEAHKLEPKCALPTVLIESNNYKLIMQKCGSITGTIYKQL